MAGEKAKLLAQFGTYSNIRSKNDLKIAIRILDGIFDIEYPSDMSGEQRQKIFTDSTERSDAMAEMLYAFVSNVAASDD